MRWQKKNDGEEKKAVCICAVECEAETVETFPKFEIENRKKSVENKILPPKHSKSLTERDRETFHTRILMKKQSSVEQLIEMLYLLHQL